MDKIKKGLGRGLSSLIGETKLESHKYQISISDLVPNKFQPRKIFENSKKNWALEYIEKKSLTSEDSFLINIKKIKKKN